MIRSLKAAVAALLLLVLSTAAAHATASGAVPCSGGSFNISANWAGFTCPDLNEELTNANNRGIIRLGTVAGTNAITANATPFALTSYQDGQHFTLKPAVQNTLTVTLNINSIGEKAVVKQNGTALASADFLTTTIYTVQYYAADDHFRVMGAVGSVGTDDDVPEAGDFGNLALTGDVTSVGLATTIAANAVALTTDTVGNYVGTVADGTGIDGTAAAEGATYTPTLDLTEISSTTWGAGAFTTMTFDSGAVDPVLTLSSGQILITAGGTAPIFGIDDQGPLRLFEEDAGGANYIEFVAPAAIGTNRQCVLVDGGAPIPDSCVGDGVDDGAGGGITDIVQDLTPQLGGPLDTNGQPIEFGTAQTDTSVVRSAAGQISVEGIAVPTISSTNTLTNKSVSLTTNTLTGSVTEFNTALASADFYTTGGTDVALADGGTGASLVDPNADRLMFWDDSAGATAYLTPAAPLTITTTTIDCDAATTSADGCSELATSAETETGTDTGRTVTPAGLLAAISGKHTISVPASAMITETTTGCAAGTTETATNLVMIPTKDCDGATQEGVQFIVEMPKSSDEGTLTARVDWSAASGSGDVIWLLSCLARSNDDAIDTAFGTEISVTDTVLTALDLHSAPESGAITPGGTWAENDVLWCRVQRDADAAGDTLNGVDAKIIGVRWLYTVNNFSDD